MRLSNETKNPPPPTHTHTVKYVTCLQVALCVEQRWNPQYDDTVADKREELN
jgi:hypothetical protein